MTKLVHIESENQNHLNQSFEFTIQGITKTHQGGSVLKHTGFEVRQTWVGLSHLLAVTLDKLPKFFQDLVSPCIKWG